MYELAPRHGEPPWRAALFPLSVDGMIGERFGRKERWGRLVKERGLYERGSFSAGDPQQTASNATEAGGQVHERNTELAYSR